ncbi:MAG: hypothetical protein ABI693_16220 [Bryobacteraceae bacterium]
MTTSEFHLPFLVCSGPSGKSAGFDVVSNGAPIDIETSEVTDIPICDLTQFVLGASGNRAWVCYR